MAGAALATAGVLLAAIHTEQYNPAGSPLAPVLLVLLVAVHVPLLRVARRWRVAEHPVRAWGAGLAAAVVLAVAAGVFLWRNQADVYTVAVNPLGSSQLGLAVQAAARMETASPLYAREYPRGGYEDLLPLLPGGVMPFAMARVAGFDWRYATLLSVALMAGLLAAAGGLFAFARSYRHRGEDPWVAMLALVAAGGAWLLVPQVWPFVHWGHAGPQWMWLAAVGFALAARWWSLAALSAGMLAALSPGWWLMLPGTAVLLWRERPGRRFTALAALLVAPLFLTLGAWRHEFFPMLRAVVGSAFRAGAALEPEQTWRHLTLHGMGDLPGLRIAVYAVGVVAVGMLAREIARRGTRRERYRLYALTSFVICLCGPVAYFFHWIGHGVLLAAMCPAALLADNEEEPPRAAASLLGGATVVVLAGLMIFQLNTRLVLVPTGAELIRMQPTTPDHLVDGFNVPSADHAWGATRRMVLGLPMRHPGPGTITIDLGTLDAEFAPFNPVVVSVNGRPRALWRDYPGAFSRVVVPVRPGDLVNGHNIIELTTNYARTPRSLNIPGDNRVVSVAYKGLVYTPGLVTKNQERIP